MRVFEGDICKVVYLDRRCNSSGEHYDAENVIIEEVAFKQGTFFFKTTIEDIGNIHDTPELLEQE